MYFEKITTYELMMTRQGIASSLSRHRVIVIAIVPSRYRFIVPSNHRHRIVTPSHHRHRTIIPSHHRHHTIESSSSHYRTIALSTQMSMVQLCNSVIHGPIQIPQVVAFNRLKQKFTVFFKPWSLFYLIVAVQSPWELASRR